ncbi:hypothetical protein MBLNU459_g2727t1 [Dothideomycetes sp. NU459]
MSDTWLYTYESPLNGWENLEPLPTERAADGKSYVNPPAKSLSPAYETFTSPIANNERGGFDVHIYFQQTNAEEALFAKQLWERLLLQNPPPPPPSFTLRLSVHVLTAILTVPELRIYTLWDRPIGPHPVAMFEVNLFTPAQFGAFVPWLVINRGPLSALLHPNTGDDIRDHSQLATWLGQPFPLQLGGMNKYLKQRAEEAAAAAKKQTPS